MPQRYCRAPGLRRGAESPWPAILRRRRESRMPDQSRTASGRDLPRHRPEQQTRGITATTGALQSGLDPLHGLGMHRQVARARPPPRNGTRCRARCGGCAARYATHSGFIASDAAIRSCGSPAGRAAAAPCSPCRNAPALRRGRTDRTARRTSRASPGAPRAPDRGPPPGSP